MHYRPEIDGLRTLAVLPVLSFHAGFTIFSGGFVGVDIFFVISGYLISTIILKELQNNRFTISNFYERRARRILPALFFVIFATLPFAWHYLLPDELIEYGKSLIAVPLFSSNILFWQSSGYFAQDSETITLLHTWSLAVEEQFYLFFPLLMIFLWRFGSKTLLAIMLLIGVSSLLFSEYAWRNIPDANFYLIFSRAWELLIGVFAAFHLFYQKPKHSLVLSQALSLIGLILIIFSIGFFNKGTPFPSLYALAPTVGAALIITFCQKGNVVHKLLSNKVMVGIGLISYSTYLWHFPLFVYARMILDEPSLTIMGLLSIVACVMGFISWRFIEKPFRDKNNFSKKTIFIFSIIVSLVVIFIGATLIYLEGAEYRFL